jgi:hypothetical protein
LLAVAAPICLLLVGALADRRLHHGPTRPALAAAAAPALESPVAAVRAKLARLCAEPSSVDGCTLPLLDAAFADDRPVLRANRNELEHSWLIDLEGVGTSVSAYGLALIGSRRALPLLRHRLLTDDLFDRRGLKALDDPAVLFADGPFARGIAYVRAIESIGGRPLREAVRPTRAERRTLRQETVDCAAPENGHWLLHQLDGAPLPTASANRAHRLACEAEWRRFFPPRKVHAL